MRVCRQDADHALKHDQFFNFCAKVETDPDLAREAQVVSPILFQQIIACLLTKVSKTLLGTQGFTAA